MATDEDIQDVFTVLDPNSSGKLPGSIIVHALRALEKNPTGEQVKALEEKYKLGISLDEFKKLYKDRSAGRHPLEQDKEMREVLSVLDRDGGGFINVVELRSILGNLGDTIDEKTLDALMKEIKVDHDGLVNYEDFVDMLVNDYPLHMTGKPKFNRG